MWRVGVPSNLDCQHKVKPEKKAVESACEESLGEMLNDGAEIR